MRTAGKLSAAIEILTDFNARRVPLKTAIADWGRGNRYAGAKDRAWISGLCLDVLRKKHSLSAAMQSDNSRALVLGAARFLWAMPIDELAEHATEEPHGPGTLSEDEKKYLQSSHPSFPAKGEIEKEAEIIELASSPCMAHEFESGADHIAEHITGNFPEWMTPHIARAFGERAANVMAGFSERADVDLRLNTIKAEPEKSLKALGSIKGQAIPVLTTAARINAPDPSQKAPAVTVIPAFNKGWVEVQDLGSQIAAAAAGDIKGAQVLDYCAGGGGKTLALAALMENTGQLYAYDNDARRLKPLYARAKRAGVRNLQVRSPAGDEGLDDLAGKMDVVFVDAPCTGAGTWRRHPDTKWRLTEKQLERRMVEQDTVLREASRFVKPGGRMVWVTCSFLMEENEDRLTAFLAEHSEFSFSPTLDAIKSSGLLTEEGNAALNLCVTPDRALRITPDKLRADGFFVAILERASA
ncbi:MAG: tRNA/rRNA methyltransferase [Hyphococcus sp.]|nr:MAG: tRNA/rRNA methyltransferase [Marinicaulis sp.]